MGKSLLVGLRPPSLAFPSGRGCLASRGALPPFPALAGGGRSGHCPHGPLPSRPQLRGGRDGLLCHGAGRGPEEVPGTHPGAGRGAEGGAADRGLQVRAGPAGKGPHSEAGAPRAESPFRGRGPLLGARHRAARCWSWGLGWSWGSRIRQHRCRADSQRHREPSSDTHAPCRLCDLVLLLNRSVLQSSLAEGDDDGTYPGVVGQVNHSGCVGAFSPVPGTPESL